MKKCHLQYFVIYSRVLNVLLIKVKNNYYFYYSQETHSQNIDGSRMDCHSPTVSHLNIFTGCTTHEGTTLAFTIASQPMKLAPSSVKEYLFPLLVSIYLIFLPLLILIHNIQKKVTRIARIQNILPYMCKAKKSCA